MNLLWSVPVLNVALHEADVDVFQTRVPDLDAADVVTSAEFFEAGFLDTFRLFESGGGHYSWWTWRNDARARNIGWRLDFFLVSASLRARVAAAAIRADIHGSDHCPVTLDLTGP